MAFDHRQVSISHGRISLRVPNQVPFRIRFIDGLVVSCYYESLIAPIVANITVLSNPALREMHRGTGAIPRRDKLLRFLTLSPSAWILSIPCGRLKNGLPHSDLNSVNFR